MRAALAALVLLVAACSGTPAATDQARPPYPAAVEAVGVVEAVRAQLAPAHPADRSREAVVTTEQLVIRLAAIGENDGATMSPLMDTSAGAGAGAWPSRPATGYAVALDRTDIALPTSPAGVFDSAAAADLDTWLRDMDPLIRSGYGWLGVWHDGDTGRVELNITLVFDDEPAAVDLAEENFQKSIWQFHGTAERPDGGEIQVTDGEGRTHYEP
ncbi:MAG TPA: hypothetical protein DEP69_01825 [Acidimicrobiaceae bacterium]|nr:hypothetical protein [Acidimicrobiaceae bacterium]